MKKIYLIFLSPLIILGACQSSNFGRLKVANQQKPDVSWLIENYGQRFIPGREVGLDSLAITFSKRDLSGDHLSAVVPFVRDGVLAYHRVQSRYRPNIYEKNDTLSLADAEKFIKTIIRAGRNFPNDDSLKFYRTKDSLFINGVKCQKTIVLKAGAYSIIDLPSSINSIIIGDKSTAYTENTKDGSMLSSLDFRNKTLVICPVMTLICLAT